jgi:hypothetical protein
MPILPNSAVGGPIIGDFRLRRTTRWPTAGHCIEAILANSVLLKDPVELSEKSQTGFF